jgi:hypothetical protein
MKRKIVFLSFITFTALSNAFATKVVSAGDNEWDQPSSWNTNAIPNKPDTIVIRHYITFGRDLIISAPTVLIIEETGTLCGDYLLDVACGAKVLNYGHLYTNTAKIRDGYNYNEFFSKSTVTILGCTPAADGFHNVPPNGHINVWPPVLCKTSGTNWPKATTNIPGNGPADELTVSISPNPLNNGSLKIAARGDFEVNLYDTRGALIYTGKASDQVIVDMRDFSNGFYFAAITYKNKQFFRKVLIEQ